MLRRIGLSNFKCWKELDIELAPITLLFGANSSGKSAVLQSLLMLKQTARGIDPGQHINFGGTDRDYVDLGSYRDLVHGHDRESKLGVRLTWDTSRPVYSVHRTSDGQVETAEFELKSIGFDIVWGLDTTIFIDHLRYDVELVDAAPEWIDVRHESADKYRWKSSFSDLNEYRTTISSPRSCYILPWEIGTRAPSAGSNSIPHIGEEFVGLVDSIEYLGPLGIRPERYYLWTGTRPDKIEPDGENAIQALIASAQADGVLANSVARGLVALGLATAFSIRTIDNEKRLYEMTARIDDVDCPIVDVGFGISQVLPVITMLMSAPEGSIVLLEQPELHLHPNAQARLADLMLEVAEKRNLQLIVESHSEHILRRLQVRIAEGQSEYANPENIRMYFCEPAKGGSTISEVELDRFGQIANWPDKFLGDISGELHTMAKEAIQRRREELING